MLLARGHDRDWVSFSRGEKRRGASFRQYRGYNDTLWTEDRRRESKTNDREGCRVQLSRFTRSKSRSRGFPVRTAGRHTQLANDDNTVTPSRRSVENCVRHGSPPDALGAGRSASLARHDARRRSASTCNYLHPSTGVAYPPLLLFSYPSSSLAVFGRLASRRSSPVLSASDRATSRRVSSPRRAERTLLRDRASPVIPMPWWPSVLSSSHRLCHG